jgi:transposase
MDRDTLLGLSKDDLIVLVLAQAAQIEALTRRVADLEARLGQPPKTPDNSSLPPSRGAKPNLPAPGDKPKRKGHPGSFRALHPEPDRVVEALACACPHCAQALTAADQPGLHAYDHIDLPPIRPIVTRVHRHRGTCPGCWRDFSAPPPDGLAPGSPFGPGLCALVLHLHVTQAIGLQRLACLLDEVFGLAISEGALANMLARAQAPLSMAAGQIAEAVRRSPVVGSDETSARVMGRTWWQWVLLSSTAVCHIIAERRARAVVSEFLGGARPEVWVADRYAGQAGHGLQRQVCLAHLLRDAQFAIDAGDENFVPNLHWLLLRALAIARRRDCLQDSTLARYRADLDRRLDRLFATLPTTRAGRRLARAIARCRGDLFVFLTRRDVPATNNACERALRPSVIFRKVTGCFRSEWGASLYAAALSVIATGRLHGYSALQAIQATLQGRSVLQPA